MHLLLCCDESPCARNPPHPRSARTVNDNGPGAVSAPSNTVSVGRPKQPDLAAIGSITGVKVLFAPDTPETGDSWAYWAEDASQGGGGAVRLEEALVGEVTTRQGERAACLAGWGRRCLHACLVWMAAVAEAIAGLVRRHSNRPLPGLGRRAQVHLHTAAHLPFSPADSAREFTVPLAAFEGEDTPWIVTFKLVAINANGVRGPVATFGPVTVGPATPPSSVVAAPADNGGANTVQVRYTPGDTTGIADRCAAAHGAGSVGRHSACQQRPPPAACCALHLGLTGSPPCSDSPACPPSFLCPPPPLQVPHQGLSRVQPLGCADLQRRRRHLHHGRAGQRAGRGRRRGPAAARPLALYRGG